MSKITDSQLTDLTNSLVEALEKCGLSGEQVGSLPIQAALNASLYRETLNVMAKSICAQVDKHTKLAIAAMPPMTVKVGDLPAKEWGEVTHPIFPDVVSVVKAGMNVMLVGPAGSGKSYIAAQVARALGVPFRGYISVTNGTSESAFLGQLCPNGEGGFTYYGTPFVEACSEGGVVCVDEVDAGDANTLLVLNAALNKDPLFIPRRFTNPVQPISDSTMPICTANTFGLGSDRVYAGRNQLDGAFLNRFVVFEVNYDPKLEERFCPDADLRQRLWEVRSAIEANRLRRFVTGRSMSRAYKLRHQCGWSDQRILRELTCGWTKDEMKLVGVAP